MTDRHVSRIDLGLIGDLPAMASPVDVHNDNSKQKRRPKAPFYHS
jgi:hypothetical protein